MKARKPGFLGLVFVCLCIIFEHRRYMPEVPPNSKTRITEMSANEQESIIAKVKGRLKEKRFGYLLKKKKPDLVCQEWDSNPRLHSETRTLATI